MHSYTAQNEAFYENISDLLLLLSIGLTNPTKELAAGLADGSYLHDLEECFQGIWPEHPCNDQYIAINKALRVIRSTAKTYQQLGTEEIYTILNREYNRLFLNPRKELIPVYESLLVHKGEKTSMFINATCMHAEQTYRHNHFPFEEKNKVPGDHLAIELRYLSYLFSARLGAAETADAPAAANIDAALEDFLTSHVKRWYEPFWNEVKTHSKDPFYLLLAEMGEGMKKLLQF